MTRNRFAPVLDRQLSNGIEGALRSDQLSMSRHRTKTAHPGPSKGLYANYFEVRHTAFEVVVDFGQTYKGDTTAPCHTRIVMSPIYARALLQTFGEALAAYTDQFGEIQ